MVFFDNKVSLNDFIKKHNIDIGDFNIKKLIEKAFLYEKISAFILRFFIIITIISIILLIGKGLMGLGLLIIVGIPLLLLYILFTTINSSQYNKIEKYIYETFVKDRIKVFGSIDLLKDYSYEIVKDAIYDKVLKSNDIKMFFAFEALDLNADGYAIAHQNIKDTLGYSLNIRKGEVESIRDVVYEVTFIKNIKKLEHPNNISGNKENNIESNKDLNYWFELKEKGAITQEEYEKKKKDILG